MSTLRHCCEAECSYAPQDWKSKSTFDQNTANLPARQQRNRFEKAKLRREIAQFDMFDSKIVRPSGRGTCRGGVAPPPRASTKSWPVSRQLARRMREARTKPGKRIVHCGDPKKRITRSLWPPRRPPARLRLRRLHALPSRRAILRANPNARGQVASFVPIGSVVMKRPVAAA